MNADARIISGSLVDAKNVGVHKSLRLIIDVPQELAMEVIEKLGWPTMASPIPVAVARLNAVVETGSAKNAVQQTAMAQTEVPKPAPVPEQAPARAKKSWREKSYAEQAAILGSDARFRRFLLEENGVVGRTGVCEAISEAKAAEMIRAHCLVASRSDIRDNHPSARIWREMVERFRVWEMAPSVGAA